MYLNVDNKYGMYNFYTGVLLLLLLFTVKQMS